MRVHYCDLCGLESVKTITVKVGDDDWTLTLDLCANHWNELQVFLTPRKDAMGFRVRSVGGR